jgi:hypothetical protein
VLLQGVHLEDEYPRSGPATISSWTRTVMYLRPGTFVVYDRTAVTDPHLDQWLAFVLAGRPTAAGAPADGARRYDVVGRSGYAGSVYTVLPVGHVDSAAGFFGGTKCFRLEVRPGRADRVQQWLTAFDAAPSPCQAATVTPIQATGEPAGVLVRRAGTGEAVLLGGEDPADVRYARPSGPTLNVITGLRPGATYSVSTGGGRVDVHPGPGMRASASGVITFRTA